MIYHDDKLGLEEYRSHVLDSVSGIIVNPNYIKNNTSFFDSLLFKMFQDYEGSQIDPISLNKQIKMLNMFLSIMILEKPDLTLPEDTINLC